MITARFNLAVVSVSVFLVFLVPVVQAKNWGGQKADPPPNVMCTEYLNTSECTPNNFTHQVYFSTTYPITDPALDTALRASMANDYDALAGVSVTEIFNNNADVLDQFVTINRNWDMAYTTCQPGATTGYDNIRHYMWCRRSNWSCRKMTAPTHSAGTRRHASPTTCATSSAIRSVSDTGRRRYRQAV